MRFSDSRHHGYDRRGEQERQGGGRRYNDPNRMNEETFGSTAVREQREQYNKGENLAVHLVVNITTVPTSALLGRHLSKASVCHKNHD